MDNQRKNNRRQALKAIGLLGGATFLPVAGKANSPLTGTTLKKNFSYCLNTSTIMGQKQGIVKDMQTAAKAGYDGIEIWINALQKYVEEGGKLSALKKLAEDLNLKIENAIGFAPWIVNDQVKRKAALDQARKEMELLAQVGCTRIAAPPAGATDVEKLNLDEVAERFCALLEVGKEVGVIPQLEVWGFSNNLHRLDQVLYVAAGCNDDQVRILPDVYHLYRGGSKFLSLQLLSGKSVEIFHINDYPSSIPPSEIEDKDRVYPGDGDGPVIKVLQMLAAAGGPKVLSLELFNRAYWKQDALVVAKTGLQKMKAAVKQAQKTKG